MDCCDSRCDGTRNGAKKIGEHSSNYLKNEKLYMQLNMLSKNRVTRKNYTSIFFHHIAYLIILIILNNLLIVVADGYEFNHQHKNLSLAQMLQRSLSQQTTSAMLKNLSSITSQTLQSLNDVKDDLDEPNEIFLENFGKLLNKKYDRLPNKVFSTMFDFTHQLFRVLLDRNLHQQVNEDLMEKMEKFIKMNEKYNKKQDDISFARTKRDRAAESENINTVVKLDAIPQVQGGNDFTALNKLLKKGILISPKLQGAPRFEAQLIHDILATYHTDIRPTETVTVKLKLILTQVIAMHEKEQQIVTNVFIDQRWIDPRISWQKEHYGGIGSIRLPVRIIWIPDTFMYNAADKGGFLMPHPMGKAIVSHKGQVHWPNPFAQLKTRCRVDISEFPFDVQVCELVFGSWSHTNKQIDYVLELSRPDLTLYAQNSEWFLLDLSAQRDIIHYSNWVESNSSFTEIKYKIFIRRKPLHITYNIVLPCMMLSLLTLISFAIPFQQQVHICISTLLSYSVYSLLVSERVPAQSDSVPWISIYLTLTMGFTLSALMWFAFTNEMKHQTQLAEKNGKFFRLITCHLRKLVCVGDEKTIIEQRQRKLKALGNTLSDKDLKKTKTVLANAKAALHRHSPTSIHHMAHLLMKGTLIASGMDSKNYEDDDNVDLNRIPTRQLAATPPPPLASIVKDTTINDRTTESYQLMDLGSIDDDNLSLKLEKINEEMERIRETMAKTLPEMKEIVHNDPIIEKNKGQNRMNERRHGAIPIIPAKMNKKRTSSPCSSEENRSIIKSSCSSINSCSSTYYKCRNTNKREIVKSNSTNSIEQLLFDNLKKSDGYPVKDLKNKKIMENVQNFYGTNSIPLHPVNPNDFDQYRYIKCKKNKNQKRPQSVFIEKNWHLDKTFQEIPITFEDDFKGKIKPSTSKSNHRCRHQLHKSQKVNNALLKIQYENNESDKRRRNKGKKEERPKIEVIKMKEIESDKMQQQKLAKHFDLINEYTQLLAEYEHLKKLKQKKKQQEVTKSGNEPKTTMNRWKRAATKLTHYRPSQRRKSSVSQKDKSEIRQKRNLIRLEIFVKTLNRFVFFFYFCGMISSNIYMWILKPLILNSIPGNRPLVFDGTSTRNVTQTSSTFGSNFILPDNMTLQKMNEITHQQIYRASQNGLN
ncbi:hypothetical protein SNEBB_005444 [Seison nebaliae]|nr:hypothetical protein SNEBB_005444 [Seison nebaliae]